MDMLIILTYTAICVFIFKVFKIPLNKWSVPTAVLGGVLVLSAIMVIMNYNHPYAKYAKEVFASVPIVPQIAGTVKTVEVQPNQHVKQGDVLFTLVNDEQVIALRKAEAALADARSGAFQKDEALQVAMASTDEAKANRDRAKTTYLRYKEGFDNGGENSPFTPQEMDQRLKLYEASEAKLKAALADQRRLEFAAESLIAGEDTEVAQLIEARNKAQLDLERTTVRAPTDGMAAQIALRPGVRATKLPLRPAMTFIPKEKRRIAAMFWQNSLQRMEVGLEAEVILDSIPGKVFTGKLVSIVPAMQEGEIQATGALIQANVISRHGFVVGLIELDEDLNDYNLPLGIQGQAVALNHDGDFLHTSIVRRILLRMMAWLKYIYPIK
ncbi:HlyD family secretion protein [Thalassotalea sp. Y01]|uniref:HlyD family secretion protein n=1 Tax=Thalassotalea sp. Y01 TaxID=2729613 RepID=UPI00145CA575|nr:HlyD family secretion protein [Thalassotalea sp. Y01]NMP17800.1 HlyD family secretion protein [Thalassotalea sp. Y01]